MLDQSQIFVSTQPVPRRPVAVLSVLAHLAVLAAIVALAHVPQARMVQEKLVLTDLSGRPRVAFSSPAVAKGSPRRFTVPRAHRPAPMAPLAEVGATEGTASETLVENARNATAGIVTGLKQRQVYGFDPNNYQIPYHLSGDFPVIAASEVPPRFEQYVTVEITIDVDGSVARAKIVSGSIDQIIQHKLLSAALGFKYSPARRDGTPIPSQLDLVVHIPS